MPIPNFGNYAVGCINQQPANHQNQFGTIWDPYHASGSPKGWGYYGGPFDGLPAALQNLAARQGVFAGIPVEPPAAMPQSGIVYLNPELNMSVARLDNSGMGNHPQTRVRFTPPFKRGQEFQASISNGKTTLTMGDAHGDWLLDAPAGTPLTIELRDNSGKLLETYQIAAPA